VWPIQSKGAVRVTPNPTSDRTSESGVELDR
jgi:hypothetical protein